ncbi:D-alanyl-D-alanine dipeptidase [filamentous cyanobacterium LEGE 11480]|uniref:D-alanyl-D-alanine dipeptidase n=1 Tax=Romeriopsis navalis LEGE 11480 TaxID=2777977 RepID=A0A928VML1_9CYAN|nr:M15 family metallopeptidase [Romeriopsis navalis]MBE9031326.1 D-alanyl-D-alanine dipeptidase [Romeriopsis navalis LEGE 11480]
MKPYQRIPIHDSHEPLLELPAVFARFDPHPYAKLGAPYPDYSPFALRSSVVERLQQAQTYLQQLQPGWRLQVFDAYRPVPVQQFMVEYTLAVVCTERGWAVDQITPQQRQEALAQVHQFWAVPNLNPLTPPPHSTGAAVDLTLIDAQGRPVDMGGELDELSLRSYPDHYVGLADASAEMYDAHRQLLNYCMAQAGFERHYHEWWHFSYGDQLWAWLRNRRHLGQTSTAQYGRFAA